MTERPASFLPSTPPDPAQPDPVHFDLGALEPALRYKLLTATVVPRPIAWVCTLGPGGVNVAPYSFFGLMGSDPPVVVFSPGERPDGSLKDTARNIGEDGEFVVNLVDEALAGAMNLSAADFPPDRSEAEALGLALSPGQQVAVPRLSAAPAALECRARATLSVGRNRLIVGEVLGLWVRGGAVQDAARGHIDTAALGLIGRMGGSGSYARTRDTFELRRLSYAQWQAGQGGGQQGSE